MSKKQQLVIDKDNAIVVQKNQIGNLAQHIHNQTSVDRVHTQGDAGRSPLVQMRKKSSSINQPQQQKGTTQVNGYLRTQDIMQSYG